MESRVKGKSDALAAIRKLSDDQRAKATQIPMKDYQEQVTKVSPNPVWIDEASIFKQDILDAAIYGQSASHVRREKTLADFGDAELVMEMIRRGYAAMKLPADGGPPEVLRK